MEYDKLVNLGSIHNKLYKVAGALILILNKLRHDYSGYTTPRAFPMHQYGAATNYDIMVVDNWLSYLSKYSSGNLQINNNVVLELGPGADLGVGLYLLFKGASQYNALDVNNLVSNVPQEFYDHFFKLLNMNGRYNKEIIFLQSQLELTRKNKKDRLNYICRKDFSFSDFENKSIDLVFSQAAFEHFDNVEETVCQLSRVAKSGTVLIAEIDLKTHSRWIRDKDPLNIYRYGQSFYKLCKFRGTPNRIRPFQYEQIFKKYGWKNIQSIPKTVLDNAYLKKVVESLDKSFKHVQNDMGLLSIIFCATKA